MWVYALLVAVLTGLVAWLEYYPASPMITDVGLPGPRADADRHCGALSRQLPGPGSYGFRIEGPGDLVYQWRPERRRSFARVLHIPTRRVVCEGRGRVDGPFARQRVSLDALTRRISHVQRSWYVDDSSSWEHARDSIATAMVRLGGRTLACRKPERLRTLIPDTSAQSIDRRSPHRGWATPDIRDTRSWQLPNYTVRLTAYRMYGDLLLRTPWLLQLDGYPGPPPGCRWPIRRRLFPLRPALETASRQQRAECC